MGLMQGERDGVENLTRIRSNNGTAEDCVECIILHWFERISGL